MLKKGTDSYIIVRSWDIMICERNRMKRQYKKITTYFLLMIIMMLAMIGCVPQEEKIVVPVTENTLEVTEEGALISYLVEDFDKDYYVLEELDAMVREEVAEYVADQGLVSESGEAQMAVESVFMAEDGSKKVVVALRFANVSVYNDYYDTDLFYGTVEDAVAHGYELNAALTHVEDGELFGREDEQKNKRRMILITEESVMIRLPKKILYVGTNVAVTEAGFADGTQSEGLKLIITK